MFGSGTACPRNASYEPFPLPKRVTFDLPEGTWDEPTPLVPTPCLCRWADAQRQLLPMSYLEADFEAVTTALSLSTEVGLDDFAD